MRELQITELDDVYGGVDDSLTVAGLTITGVRAGLTLGAVGAAVGAAGSVGWGVGGWLAENTNIDEWLADKAWNMFN